MEETRKMLEIIEKQYRISNAKLVQDLKKKKLHDKLELILFTALYTFCITIFFIM